ncbi:MAG: hypothetical protein HQL79_10195 [Magnetococcales bacterium]|nr:hypothetical protein [Magnetococcales bacterium]
MKTWGRAVDEYLTYVYSIGFDLGNEENSEAFLKSHDNHKRIIGLLETSGKLNFFLVLMLGASLIASLLLLIGMVIFHRNDIQAIKIIVPTLTALLLAIGGIFLKFWSYKSQVDFISVVIDVWPPEQITNLLANLREGGPKKVIKKKK